MSSDMCLRRGCFVRFDSCWKVKKLQVFGDVFAPRRLPEIGVYSKIKENAYVRGREIATESLRIGVTCRIWHYFLTFSTIDPSAKTSISR